MREQTLHACRSSTDILFHHKSSSEVHPERLLRVNERTTRVHAWASEIDEP